MSDIICGDCLEEMEKLEENSVDSVSIFYEKEMGKFYKKVLRYYYLMSKEYRDREWLYEQYVEKERSITDIAEELGVDHTTISKWRRKLDIPKPNKKVELECPVCGTEFTRFEGQLKDIKYTPVCSRECLYKARSQGIIKREVEGGYNLSDEGRKSLRKNAKKNLSERWDQYTPPKQDEKRIKKNCEVCGEEMKIIPSKAKNPHQGKYCSRECYRKARSEMMKGENNWAYIDGRSYERMKFRGKEWRRIREKAIQRDNEKCVECGLTRSEHFSRFGQDLHVHHIEPFRKNHSNDLDKLETLCVKCHSEKEVDNGEK